jgi:formyltetrahydrofolate deformylase
MEDMTTYVLTLRLPDRPGIVHLVSGALVEIGGNIVENAQFSEPVSGLFCMRTRFESSETEAELIRTRINQALSQHGPTGEVQMSLRDESQRQRVMIMVSKHEHCLLDLLYRHDEGELPVDIPVVVSNHWDCQELVARYGIPFVRIPVTKETKTGICRFSLKVCALNWPVGRSTFTTRSCPVSKGQSRTTKRMIVASN